MRIFKLTTLAVLLFTVMGELFAVDNKQNDFVITNQNDTVFGEVLFNVLRETPEVIKFRKAGEGEFVKYLPDEIKRFRHQADMYISKNTPVTDSIPGNGQTERKFLLVGVEGTVSLYSYVNAGFVRKFYVEKDNRLYPLDYRNNVEYNQNGQKFVTEDNSFSNQLKFLLQEKTSLFDRIDKADYDDKSLILIINSYDNQGAKASVYVSKREKDTTLVKVGLTLGASIGKLFFSSGNYEYNYLWESDFTSNVAPVVGLNIEYFFRRATSRFSLFQEILYTPYKYSYEYISNTLKHTYFKTVFDISYLNLTHMLRYNLKTKGVCGFYIGAGGTIGLTLKTDNYVLKRYLDNTNSVELYTEPLRNALAGFSSLRGAFDVAAGARYKKLNVEYRFSYGNGLTNSSSSYNSAMLNHIVSLQYAF